MINALSHIEHSKGVEVHNEDDDDALAGAVVDLLGRRTATSPSVTTIGNSPGYYALNKVRLTDVPQQGSELMKFVLAAFLFPFLILANRIDVKGQNWRQIANGDLSYAVAALA